jgi:hypothetical protein
MERAKLIALRLYLTAQALLLVSTGVVAVGWLLAHRDAAKEDAQASAYESKAAEMAKAVFDAADDIVWDDEKQEPLKARAKAKRAEEGQAAAEFDPDEFLRKTAPKRLDAFERAERELEMAEAEARERKAAATAREKSNGRLPLPEGWEEEPAAPVSQSSTLTPEDEIELVSARAAASRQAGARAREREGPLVFLAILLSGAVVSLWAVRRWLRWILKPPPPPSAPV